MLFFTFTNHLLISDVMSLLLTWSLVLVILAMAVRLLPFIMLAILPFLRLAKYTYDALHI